MEYISDIVNIFGGKVHAQSCEKLSRTKKKKMLGKRGINARKNAADRLEVIKRPMSVIKRRS